MAYARALLDAHQIAGEVRFLERARRLARAVTATFEAPQGGFYDRARGAQSFGRLALEDRPIAENGLFADVLLRLAALTGDRDYRRHAERTLQLYTATSRAAGPFAATYARALRRYLKPELTVRIVGDPGQSDEFREAALRLPSPLVTIRTILPSEAGELDLPQEPAAYVCVTGTCGPPVRTPGALRAAYDALVA